MKHLAVSLALLAALSLSSFGQQTFPGAVSANCGEAGAYKSDWLDFGHDLYPKVLRVVPAQYVLPHNYG
jgi:hypothetical protein